jgi:hypothetical protein
MNATPNEHPMSDPSRSPETGTPQPAWTENVTENAKKLYRIQMDYYNTPSRQVIEGGANTLWEYMDQRGVRAAGSPEGGTAPTDEWRCSGCHTPAKHQVDGICPVCEKVNDLLDIVSSGAARIKRDTIARTRYAAWEALRLAAALRSRVPTPQNREPAVNAVSAMLHKAGLPMPDENRVAFAMDVVDAVLGRVPSGSPTEEGQ